MTDNSRQSAGSAIHCCSKIAVLFMSPAGHMGPPGPAAITTRAALLSKLLDDPFHKQHVTQHSPNTAQIGTPASII
jgi:hypothetical protein